jgi:outer membrane protein OmpA-like peptidoglycan-associated protein
MSKRLIAMGTAAVLTACGLPANVVVLIPDEGGTVGGVAVADHGAQVELSAPYEAIGTGDGTRSGDVFVANRRLVENVFTRALAATPRAPTVYVIYFILGQTEVDPRSADTLAAAVNSARSTVNADISVVGHTDAIGDDNENLSLSLRRAQAVRDALVDGSLRPFAIEIGYHGSNNPRVPQPRGVPEPENRRVEVTIR